MTENNFPTTDKWLKEMFPEPSEREKFLNMCWYIHSGYEIPITRLVFPTGPSMKIVGNWLCCVADFNKKYRVSEMPGNQIQVHSSNTGWIVIYGARPVESPDTRTLISELMPFKLSLGHKIK